MSIIIVVEDELIVGEYLSDILTGKGYSVVAAANAESAIAMLENRDDVRGLITDINMPGMSGVELYQRLIEAGRTIPTILITAYPDKAIRDQALRDGVVCFLSKPVDDKHLDRCLRSALQPGTPIEDKS